VAVILEETIEMARIGRESRSPILLILAEAGKRGKVSLSGKQISHKLAGKLDLPSQLNQK
jgi:hypothetical protein